MVQILEKFARLLLIQMAAYMYSIGATEEAMKFWPVVLKVNLCQL